MQGSQAGDQDCWQEFCGLYGPVIRGFALKADLTETEADEVLQETTNADWPLPRRNPFYT